MSQKKRSFHIKLNGSKSIRESHRIATAIERNIYDELCISTTIHVDPDILETCGGDSSH